MPCKRCVPVELAGEVLADSTRALRVLETSHPPTIYIPLADVHEELLAESDARATLRAFAIPVAASLSTPRPATSGAPSTSATALATISFPTTSLTCQDGGFYGWPWWYMGAPIRIRATKAKHPELKAKVITPDVVLQPPHYASLQLTFYTGKQFPARIRAMFSPPNTARGTSPSVPDTN